MGNLVKSLVPFESTEQKIKELCKLDGVGKEKAASIVKYLFTDTEEETEN
jgi:endonuclease III-like uncharacterized protein